MVVVMVVVMVAVVVVMVVVHDEVEAVESRGSE